jgi:hypothetical protein
MGESSTRRLLSVYLRDHWAGSAAGVALAARCRRNNVGTDYEPTLADVEREIGEDRDRLRALMTRLEVSPSRTKAVLGALTELVARIKANGRIVRYSPSSRVVELETLAAGIATKGQLWRSLRAAGAQAGLEGSAAELDDLERRATNQLARLSGLHDRAAAQAFDPAEGDRT